MVIQGREQTSRDEEGLGITVALREACEHPLTPPLSPASRHHRQDPPQTSVPVPVPWEHHNDFLQLACLQLLLTCLKAPGCARQPPRHATLSSALLVCSPTVLRQPHPEHHFKYLIGGSVWEKIMVSRQEYFLCKQNNLSLNYKHPASASNDRNSQIWRALWPVSLLSRACLRAMKQRTITKTKCPSLVSTCKHGSTYPHTRVYAQTHTNTCTEGLFFTVHLCGCFSTSHACL